MSVKSMMQPQSYSIGLRRRAGGGVIDRDDAALESVVLIWRRTVISKAVILLCAARKNRDADHLQNFVYDALAGIDADKLAADLLKGGKVEIPDYAFDCHTLKGKRAGKTKADFFREEQRALKPFQPGLFDDLPES